MSKIIGGVYALELSKLNDDIINNNYYTKNSLLFNTARSALYYILKKTKFETIWLPSYICPSIVMLIKKMNINYKFYTVNFNLRINTNFLNNITKNDIIYLIDYFGFRLENKILENIVQCKSKIIRDLSMSFFIIDNISDYVIYSPRKFFAIPDGGILKIKDKAYKNIKLKNPPFHWWFNMYYSMLLRRDYDKFYCYSREWIKLFYENEYNCPIGYYKMSRFSEELLKNKFDYNKISANRQNNYSFLYKNLKNLALLNNIDNIITPFGFPIIFKNRNYLKRKLLENNIFAQIHWCLKDIIPSFYKDSLKLSDEILTLPCDHRYSKEDMQIIINLVKKLTSVNSK